jgi:hypothetical protein
MRTKTLLLTAALVIASVATSMAQVYSVNIVGYVNLSISPGFNLVANQLKVAGTPANALSAVIPTAPEETEVLKYVSGNYTKDIFLGGAWLNAVSGDPSTTTISPGEGFFYNHVGATPTTVTLVGEVTLGASTVPLGAGFNLVSTVVPQAIELTPANSFPVVEEMEVLTHNAATAKYNTSSIYLGGEWLNSVTGLAQVPAPAVGQGYFVNNVGPATSWTRTFTP